MNVYVMQIIQEIIVNIQSVITFHPMTQIHVTKELVFHQIIVYVIQISQENIVSSHYVLEIHPIIQMFALIMVLFNIK
jgi:hypothetical protein